jgi:hypothetical protein
MGWMVDNIYGLIINVKKTIYFKPPMTGNGRHTTCKKCDFPGDGSWKNK